MDIVLGVAEIWQKKTPRSRTAEHIENINGLNPIGEPMKEEHTKFSTKRCSIPGQCLLIGPSTSLRELSLQMPIETAKYIVLACNAHAGLVKACKALVSSHGMHGPCNYNGCRDCTNAYKKGKAALALATPPVEEEGT